jgi:hypothetical protein
MKLGECGRVECSATHKYIQFAERKLVNFVIGCVKGKGKAIPLQGLDRPWGFQEVVAAGFLDSQHMKVVRLSALRTGRLYGTENIPGTHFC